LFARAIHKLSPRAKSPFIAVNCGALPDTLLESGLLGYKAAAFTDARKDKPGRIAAAEGGSLFLDQIGDLSPALQVRLLRFLQECAYEPLGSTQPVRADVRIIAATDKKLEELVQANQFRDDLYDRINVVKLQIPPLRDRREDVPLLIGHFISRFNLLQAKKFPVFPMRCFPV
jgi:transcriptional regulator with PAS, ATPase and Fis domain